MRLEVKEVDGRLEIVAVDDDGNVHIIDNIDDGTPQIQSVGHGYWRVDLTFTF